MSSFLEACGATGPLHWEVEGPAGVDRLALDMPFLLVGRDPASDLRLRHSDVSDRHAYLQLVGGRLFCVDLGSRTGIHLDGRCRRSGWVDSLATIRVGPFRLRLTEGDRQASADDSPAVADTGLNLELAHRSIRKTGCAPTGALVLVGSSADCQARLLDPSVSDFHCALLPTPKGTWVVDLLGRGGIAINGTTARLGRVYEGDMLQVGASLVRLRVPGEEIREPDAHDEMSALGAPPHASSSRSVPARVAAVDLAPLLSDLPPEKAEMAQTLLAPLVQQFGLMQQQMFEQLQKAERARFQALAAFQQEQFGAIREELDQLRELRQELDDLRGEMKAQRRVIAPRERPTAEAASRPRLGSAAPAVSRDDDLPADPPSTLEPSDVLRISVNEAS